MPLLFIGTGLVLILTGVKGDPGQLWELVAGDFSGPNNYVYWMVSILVLGALGYVDQLKQLSKVFIALVVLVLLLHNHGFFAQLQSFINSTQSQQPTGASGSF